MNNEETKKEELEVVEPAEVLDYEDDYEESENGLGLKIGLGLAIAGGILGGLAYKNRKKIEKRRVEKLRKKGYTIIEPVEAEDLDYEEEFVDEDFVDSEEEVTPEDKKKK